MEYLANLYFNQPIIILDTSASVGLTTGSLISYGGASISGNTYIGGATVLQGGLTASSLNVTGNLFVGGPVMKIPTGDIASRPLSPAAGNIRYNTETQQFEGYGPGSAWGSLGGVIDIAQTTKILASETPSTTDGNLYFYTVNGERMRINSAGNIGIGTSAPSYLLDVNGSINSTSLYINGTVITATATELNYTDITTIGTAQASKALIVDANKDIISIRNLTATNLTGTIQTASQTNITSVGTLTGLTSSGQISITNNTSSTNASTGALIVTGGIGNSGNINSGQIIKCGINNTSYNTIGTGGAYFQTGNSTITNSGATSSSTIATAVFSSFARPTLAATNTLVITTNASTIYIENEPLNGTNMTLSNSYALWVNAGKVLLGTGFGSTNKSIATLTINADTLRSNTEGLEHGLLISGGNTIANTCLYMGADNTNSVSYIQSSKVGANLPLILNNRGGNVGIGLNSPSYTLDVAGDINLTGSLRFSGTAITASATELNKLNGVTATTAELNFLDITSAGTAQASKALILDSSSYINGINKIVFNAASTTRQVSSPGDYRCIDTNTITFNNAVTAASGTDTAHQASNFIGRHTITATNTNVTTTTFSTFYIQGEPLNGTNMTITNKYALFINSRLSLVASN